MTGATSGIGYETALGLAKRGARVLMVGRNRAKAESSAEIIREQSRNPAIEVVVADLSSQADIRRAAAYVSKKHSTIDVLINNAGIWLSKYQVTEDGIETMFAVNHLAYFYLTHLLMPLLTASGSGRIINVGSDSHFQGKMHFEDLNLSRKYHGLRAYGQSKLANILFTYELDRKLKEKAIPVTVNCVQPGLVKTDIGLKHTISFHGLAWKFRRLAGVTAAEGASTSIFLAEAQEVDGISGKYWDKCKVKASSKASYNSKDAHELWAKSLELCKIKDYFTDGL